MKSTRISVDRISQRRSNSRGTRNEYGQDQREPIVTEKDFQLQVFSQNKSTDFLYRKRVTRPPGPTYAIQCFACCHTYKRSMLSSKAH